MRCFRYKDLYDKVLFNYEWLYHKMCARPLPEVRPFFGDRYNWQVLGDFEDAVQNIRPDKFKKGGETIVHVRPHLSDLLNCRSWAWWLTA